MSASSPKKTICRPPRNSIVPPMIEASLVAVWVASHSCTTESQNSYARDDHENAHRQKDRQRVVVAHHPDDEHDDLRAVLVRLQLGLPHAQPVADRDFDDVQRFLLCVDDHLAGERHAFRRDLQHVQRVPADRPEPGARVVQPELVEEIDRARDDLVTDAVTHGHRAVVHVRKPVAKDHVRIAVDDGIEQQRYLIGVVGIVAVEHHDDLRVRGDVPEARHAGVAVADVLLRDHTGPGLPGLLRGIVCRLVHDDDLHVEVLERLACLVDHLADGRLVHRRYDHRYLDLARLWPAQAARLLSY